MFFFSLLVRLIKLLKTTWIISSWMSWMNYMQWKHAKKERFKGEIGMDKNDVRNRDLAILNGCLINEHESYLWAKPKRRYSSLFVCVWSEWDWLMMVSETWLFCRGPTCGRVYCSPVPSEHSDRLQLKEKERQSVFS